MFRLWIITAILWVGWVAWSSADIVPPECFYDGQGIPSDFNPAKYGFPAPSVDKHDPLLGYCPGITLAEIAKAVADALGLPLGALAVWFTGAWVRRGFRETTP
jgi:hypothetical protein